MTGTRLRHLFQASTGIGALGLVVAAAASSPSSAEHRQQWLERPPRDDGGAATVALRLAQAPGVPAAPHTEQERAAPPAAPAADAQPGAPESDGLLAMRAEGLTGRTVYSETGEPVAQIDDVVVLDDRVQLVLSVGGFLGLMTEQVALPVGEFELRIDRVVLTRAVTREELEAMASYESARATPVPRDEVIGQVMTAVRPPKGAWTDRTRPAWPEEEDAAAAAGFQRVLLPRGTPPPITGAVPEAAGGATSRPI